MIRSLVTKTGGALAAAALAFSFSAAPAGAATLNLNFPDTCTLSGSAPNLTLTCNNSSGPGAPSCSISSSAPNNALPAGGGSVTVNVNCSGGSPPYSYSWNTGDTTPSIAKNISLTTQFTATVTDSASQRSTQSLTVTINNNNNNSGSLANCTNQGYSVMGGNAIPITWGGQGQTFFSTASGSFGDSAAWVFSITPTAASSGYGRMVVSEYGGNAYMREISVSTTPCDWNLNPQPPLISGGTTASVYFGSYSSSPSYPWVLAVGTTYYVSIRNFSVALGSPSCGQGNCQAILNVAPAN